MQGERVNIDIKLQLGTIVAVSNVPSNDVCGAGGSSFINFFSYKNGQSPDGEGKPMGEALAGGMGAGFSVLRLPPTDDGKGNKVPGEVGVLSKQSDDKPPSFIPAPITPNSPAGKRVTWREVLKPSN